MKIIKLLSGCFIAMTLLYACFDDEGNYDLSELTTVDIRISYTQPSIGEAYVIEPEIDYKGGYVIYKIHGVIQFLGKKSCDILLRK